MKLSPRQRDLQLQIIFVFMIIYALLLFVVRPQPSSGQVIFRVGMAVIGLLGMGYVEHRKQGR